MPSFKMDSYFMEPPGRAAPLCVTFSTLKVHCLWNLIFGSNFYLFHWYQWTVSGTTFVHCWGHPLTEILRSKNSSRTTSWHGITCPNPTPKQSALSKMWGPAGWPGRRLGTGLIQRRLWSNLLATFQHVKEREPWSSYWNTAQAEGRGSGWILKNTKPTCFHHENS